METGLFEAIFPKFNQNKRVAKRGMNSGETMDNWLLQSLKG